MIPLLCRKLKYMNKSFLLVLAGLFILFSCNNGSDNPDAHSGATKPSQLHYKEEVHFANIQQLTKGGDHAEAYWSFDDSKLVLQATNEAWGSACDQIYIYDVSKADEDFEPMLVSTGKGRTTCSYFLPGNDKIVYATTHLVDDNCPEKPAEREDKKYVWPIYSSFDIVVADLEGNVIDQLTEGSGYDAEATVSPKGDKIVFTSIRSGDLELYTMNIDGSGVKQITHDLGYDGGAFFSPDGSKLVFRASRPKTNEEIKVYTELLSEGLVMPTEMELFVCDTDGSNLEQITFLGGANWCPFFHPSGKKIIFSSNHGSKSGHSFNLYMVNIDGTDLEQISYDGIFDAFPVFSNDGKKLVFSSNRENGGTKETNLFLVDWVE